MDVRRDVDGMGLDQTFLYMTVLLHSLALVFCLLLVSSCPCSCLLVRSCRLGGIDDVAKNCSFVLFDGFLDDGYEGLFPCWMIALRYFCFECWVDGSMRGSVITYLHFCITIIYQIRSER
jgi:hypothetical protein